MDGVLLGFFHRVVDGWIRSYFWRTQGGEKIMKMMAVLLCIVFTNNLTLLHTVTNNGFYLWES